MNVRYSLAAVLVGLVGMAAMYAPAANGDTEAREGAIVGIRSNDAKMRLAAARELTGRRAQTIEALIAILKEPVTDSAAKAKDPASAIKAALYSTRQLAIEVLGEYRATEAVGVLIANISYLGVSLDLGYKVASAYPSVRALGRIGTPSLAGIIARLDQSTTDKEMKLFATVFRIVDGEDVAILRAELALREAEGLRRKNLGQLVTLLKARRWYF